VREVAGERGDNEEEEDARKRIVASAKCKNHSVHLGGLWSPWFSWSTLIHPDPHFW